MEISGFWKIINHPYFLRKTNISITIDRYFFATGPHHINLYFDRYFPKSQPISKLILETSLAEVNRLRPVDVERRKESFEEKIMPVFMRGNIWVLPENLLC